MVPMMQLRRSNKPPQPRNRQPYIRVNIDRPDSAKRPQPRQRLKPETQQKNRQIDQPNRVNRVHRMLAMRRQPVQVLCRVMNCMKPPQKADAMLNPVPPVDKEVADENGFDRLQPP